MPEWNLTESDEQLIFDYSRQRETALQYMQSEIIPYVDEKTGTMNLSEAQRRDLYKNIVPAIKAADALRTAPIGRDMMDHRDRLLESAEALKYAGVGKRMAPLMEVQAQQYNDLDAGAFAANLKKTLLASTGLDYRTLQELNEESVAFNYNLKPEVAAEVMSVYSGESTQATTMVSHLLGDQIGVIDGARVNDNTARIRTLNSNGDKYEVQDVRVDPSRAVDAVRVIAGVYHDLDPNVRGKDGTLDMDKQRELGYVKELSDMVIGRSLRGYSDSKEDVFGFAKAYRAHIDSFEGDRAQVADRTNKVLGTLLNRGHSLEDLSALMDGDNALLDMVDLTALGEGDLKQFATNMDLFSKTVAKSQHSMRLSADPAVAGTREWKQASRDTATALAAVDSVDRMLENSPNILAKDQMYETYNVNKRYLAFMEKTGNMISMEDYRLVEDRIKAVGADLPGGTASSFELGKLQALHNRVKEVDDTDGRINARADAAGIGRSALATIGARVIAAPYKMLLGVPLGMVASALEAKRDVARVTQPETNYKSEGYNLASDFGDFYADVRDTAFANDPDSQEIFNKLPLGVVVEEAQKLIGEGGPDMDFKDSWEELELLNRSSWEQIT